MPGLMHHTKVTMRLLLRPSLIDSAKTSMLVTLFAASACDPSSNHEATGGLDDGLDAVTTHEDEETTPRSCEHPVDCQLADTCVDGRCVPAVTEDGAFYDRFELDERACIYPCLADREPDHPLLRPDCEAFGNDQTHRYTIPECLTEGEGPLRNYLFDEATQTFVIPEGSESCHAIQTDVTPFATVGRQDDLSEHCPEGAAAASVVIQRAAGFDFPVGTLFSVRCEIDRHCGGTVARRARAVHE